MRHQRVEALRHAGREATAAHQIVAGLDERNRMVETGLPIGCCQCRSGENETILLAGGAINHIEILARVARNWNCAEGSALCGEAFANDLPGDATTGKYRRYVSTQPMKDARDIDTATTRITLNVFTAQFAIRYQHLHARRDVERRIERQCDDGS